MIAPSILTANFGSLQTEIDKIVLGGADMIHVDIMDGHFVPNMSMGPCIVKALKKMTDLPLDVHLMVDNPEAVIPMFAEAGADLISVHQEVCPQLHHTVSMIHSLGCEAGVVLNPATPCQTLTQILPDLDLVLLMTVNPGFGGQSFISSMLPKISEMRRMLDFVGSQAHLEVDGGINMKTIEAAARAGADVFVVGSAIYDGVDPEGNTRKIISLLENSHE